MPMRMMHVGHMRMLVPQAHVAVRMAVRLGPRRARRMLVPVMLVVHVTVLVLQRLVVVLMLVPLGEMEPYAERHQQARSQ